MDNSSEELSASARRVQGVLDQSGVELRVVELPSSTRTASEAAQAVGCQVGQIAKSLVFRGTDSGKPVLVIASGSNRVNEGLIEVEVGEPVSIADADYVREATGFAIGGVPPVGHHTAIDTLIDGALLEFEEIWAAAGTPKAVFRLKPGLLPALTGGRVVRVA